MRGCNVAGETAETGLRLDKRKHNFVRKFLAQQLTFVGDPRQLLRKTLEVIQRPPLCMNASLTTL